MNQSILKEEKLKFEMEGAKVEILWHDYDSLIAQNDKLKKLLTDIATLYASPYQEVDDINSAMTILLSKVSSQEFIGKIGERVYAANQLNLEKTHWGEFVVIDTDSESIIAIDKNPVNAMIEAKRIKDKNYFLRQIGVITTIN